MTINNLVNNLDLNLEAHILIQSFNDETGESNVVYRSWSDYDFPWEIGQKEITYITISSDKTELHEPYLVIEYYED